MWAEAARRSLFQIAGQIPRAPQDTMDLYGPPVLVDLIKHKVLVNDHPAVSRVRRIDLAQSGVLPSRAIFCRISFRIRRAVLG